MDQIFDDLDEAIAYELDIPTQEYVDKIESISFYRANILIGAILSQDPEKIEKVKRIFKNI